jgi:hypothetical protein
MAQTTLIIENLNSPVVQSNLMFELKSLPCIKDIKVNLNDQEAWIHHSKIVSSDDIKLALEDAGLVLKIKQ